MASSKSAEQMKQEGSALESQIADARRRPLNFAWVIGKDGLFLETDRKKDPEVLWRMARRNGGGAKGARGQFSVSGKTIHLACDTDEVPAQLPTLARRFMSERGLAYEILLATPSGPVNEDIAPVTPDAPTDEALRDSLSREFADLSARLDEARQGTDQRAAGKASLLADLFQSQIDSDLKKARSALSLLSRTIDEISGTAPAPEPAKGGRITRLSALEARIDALLAETA